MTNAIEIQSVTRAHGASNALEEVSLSVPEGSILGLLGRNGAGKTTLMSLVAGQDRPSSGRVEVFGEQPYEHESVLSTVIFVRDNQRYPDRYDLKDILRIAPVYAPNWSTDAAAQLIEGLRIPGKTPIKKFSRGQLSAVAIMLGLASRAPVTLLDEPYLGLDVTARRFFHDMLLRDYTAHPRTIVLSTHLIEESEALFDRVVILGRGRIRLDVASEEIPKQAFVLSGPSAAVDRLASNRTALASHTVPGLTSATLLGTPDAELRSEAARAGVQLGAVSLQELVAAYGADTAETALMGGTRA